MTVDEIFALPDDRLEPELEACLFLAAEIDLICAAGGRVPADQRYANALQIGMLRLRIRDRCRT